MKFNKKFYSVLLAGCMTLGIAAMASAHQTLTMDAIDAADNGNLNLRWEPHYGRYIIGGGIINEEISQPNNRQTEVSGFELLFGGRKYLSQLTKKGDKFSGVFFEGDLTVEMVDMQRKRRINNTWVKEGASQEETYTSIDLLVGYKFIAGAKKKSGFTAEVAAGPRFNFGDEYYGYKEDSTEAIMRINLGYTW
ncbi:MAG TPA: hypothetical protein VEC37_02905 [Bacillota bacterium]|nr:hypothetical protein [Bacillota bacterium]